MQDGEQLVAEQDVAVLQHRVLKVRISEHAGEGFWRVEVTSPSAHRSTMTTTVSESDSFLMHLIHSAVAGEQSAWRRLGEWGHKSMCRPGPGFRINPAI